MKLKNLESFKEIALLAFAELITKYLEEGGDPACLDVRLIESVYSEEKEDIVGQRIWNAELVERRDGVWVVEEYVFDREVKF